MSITSKKVKELAAVSRIVLSDAECERYGRDIEALESMCAPLLSLSGDFSESYRARGLDAMREDTVGECLTRDAVESMAPAWEDGWIPVPRAVEGSET